MNAYAKTDKSVKMCATCRYWSGFREFDGLGTITYDMDNKKGKCCHVLWKGFSGAEVECTMECTDYEPLYR